MESRGPVGALRCEVFGFVGCPCFALCRDEDAHAMRVYKEASPVVRGGDWSGGKGRGWFGPFGADCLAVFFVR